MSVVDYIMSGMNVDDRREDQEERVEDRVDDRRVDPVETVEEPESETAGAVTVQCTSVIYDGPNRSPSSRNVSDICCSAAYDRCCDRVVTPQTDLSVSSQGETGRGPDPREWVLRRWLSPMEEPGVLLPGPQVTDPTNMPNYRGGSSPKGGPNDYSSTTLVEINKSQTETGIFFE